MLVLALPYTQEHCAHDSFSVIVILKGHQSCLPDGACDGGPASVGDHACLNDKMLNGHDGHVCHNLPPKTFIDDHSCIGWAACDKFGGQVKIGKHSCVGDKVKEISECGDEYSPGLFGHKTCHVCTYLCAASVGSHSCEGGSKACYGAGCNDDGKKTSIGDSSCRGFYSCAYLKRNVKSHSCNGVKACCGREKDVGDHECNGDCECCVPKFCQGGCDCKKKMLRG